MSNKAIGIAFQITALVLLLGILGISIGTLIINLNIRDDVEATPVVPTYPTTVPPTSTKAPPPPPTTTTSAPPAPCTSAPTVPPKTTTTAPVDPVVTEKPKTTTKAPPKTTTKAPDVPVDPSNPDSKNIAHGVIIDENDKRYGKFAEISNLYEKWMDVKVDPCKDFYHYVCGKGQKNKEQSPFDISEIRDEEVEAAMWNKDKAYWDNAPLPVKQVKWYRDKCSGDNSYTVADQEAQIKKMLQQYIDTAGTVVPFFTPDAELVMGKTAFSKMIGYAKGQFGASAFLTTFVDVDFKHPDTNYTFYVDQPHAIFKPEAFDKPIIRMQLIKEVSNQIAYAARILGLPKLDAAKLKQMATDVVDFDKEISQKMQQDPTVRRQVERNYNPYILADLNKLANNQYDWVQYIQSVLTLLGDKAKVEDTWRVIIMEKDITLTQLNNYLAAAKPVTVVNYIYLKAFDQIIGSVPAPPKSTSIALTRSHRAVLSRDKRTLTGMLRKVPQMPDQNRKRSPQFCGELVEDKLPWPATRLYVDTDITDKEARKTLKENVAEIANWIFFGFRSQLDQLNWMDSKSKKGAFNKLDNIYLNIAYPDWVTDDAQLTAHYKDLDITEQDNYMNIVLKLTNYMHMQEVAPIITPTPRDRGDFSGFIGTTNAWYQPQMNSITFPEGILQEPFYNPDYPLATIFGGLGTISGHELTHGFDDQGVQWDGIGALNAWMTNSSQTSFNAMAQCVIDEYSSFCPFPGVCVNGANTQGENIADNGGIHAAYNALKAYESLNGADPRLPGFGSAFTSDQLFFLTFAQTWCDADQDEASFKEQIIEDEHSPAIYRVLGTIQNFPAFKNAFNCPANTPYTPDKHCNVWTSKPF